MLETVLVPAAILLAVIALVGLAALSSARSPRTPPLLTAGVPAQLRCPVTGDLKRVRIGLDLPTRTLAVLSCERFVDGVITCDRACFPARTLEALA